MAGSTEFDQRDLPWVGPSTESVTQALKQHGTRLSSLTGLRNIGQGFRINEQPPGTPISMEHVITADIDPKLTPEEIAKLPPSIEEINIKYSIYDYKPVARPAYPSRGE